MTTPKAQHLHTDHTQRFEFAAATASITIKLQPVHGDIEVTSVDLITPLTGLAVDAANYFVVALKNGATTVASWSTQTGQEGSLGINTFVEMTLAATRDARRAEDGDELSLVLTETGIASLPAGAIVVNYTRRK